MRGGPPRCGQFDWRSPMRDRTELGLKATNQETSDKRSWIERQVYRQGHWAINSKQKNNKKQKQLRNPEDKPAGQRPFFAEARVNQTPVKALDDSC